MPEDLSASAPSPDAPSPAPVTASAPVEAVTPVSAVAAESADAKADAPVAVAETKPADIPAPDTVLGAAPVLKDPAAEAAKDKEIAPAAKAEDKPAAGLQKEEGGQSGEPAQLPAYEAFTLPEGLTLDDAKLGEFTKDLGEFEREAGIDHAKMQAFGQRLMDRYVAESRDAINRLNEHYTASWEKQKNDWKAAAEKDPEIGGNRWETTIGDALSAIARVGTDAQQKEFRGVMETTGLGNHPALIRHLAYLNQAIARYETETAKPLPGIKPAAAAQSKVQKRYGVA